MQSLQKWESTVVEAICKFRDDAERHITPACQRIHLILEDVYGIASMYVVAPPSRARRLMESVRSEWGPLKLDASAVHSCLELVNRVLVVSNWLAACARREVSRVKHFISWLRYGP
jgi:anaphase-promoting complex subunit 4